jgi:hypothetical protein
MIPENPSSTRYRYGLYEGFETRSQHRLRDDLGLDESAAEAILRLRNQVIELQSQVRQMETELRLQAAGQQIRLAPYREVYYEAVWIELEILE